MNYTRVKFCGLTREEDVDCAVKAGVHALGFMLYDKSKRYVSVERAGELARRVPPFVSRVGVMVNPSLEEVQSAVQVGGMDCIQLHGDESPDFIAKIEVPVIKAFRIRDRESLKILSDFSGARAWLLDSYAPGELGGTGHSFNWGLLSELSGSTVPVILAGGLSPDNIFDAVRTVQPYGVDVSSGIESAPGIKCHSRINEFMAEVHRCITHS